MRGNPDRLEHGVTVTRHGINYRNRQRFRCAKLHGEGRRGIVTWVTAASVRAGKGRPSEKPLALYNAD
jgi:hypothetical protein